MIIQVLPVMLDISLKKISLRFLISVALVVILVCTIRAPGFGESRKANLQDLAVVTGGQVF